MQRGTAEEQGTQQGGKQHHTRGGKQHQSRTPSARPAGPCSRPLSPLWRHEAPWPAPSFLSAVRWQEIQSTLPHSARAALALDDFRHVPLDDEDQVALLRKPITVLVAVLIDAGCTDVEVHAILAAHPHSYGRLYAESGGVGSIAALCDEARRPRGTLLRLTAVEQQGWTKWYDVHAEVVFGPYEGLQLLHRYSMDHLQHSDAQPWWRRPGWFRLPEACGVDWGGPQAPIPGRDWWSALAGHHVWARLDLDGDERWPVRRWLPRAISSPELPTGPSQQLPTGTSQHTPGIISASSDASSAQQLAARQCSRHAQRAQYDAPLPNAVTYHHAEEFRSALTAMAAQGLRLDLAEWERRYHGFTKVLHLEQLLLDQGLAVRPRRKSPQDLLNQLASYDAKLREQLEVSPDGRIRCGWHTTSWPGRITAHRPSLQSLSSEMRPAFEPMPGSLFVLVDLCACQPHVLAVRSACPALKRLFAEADDGTGPDYYVVMAGLVWPDLPPDRDAGKAVTLPLLFGARAAKLAQKAAQGRRPIPPGDVGSWYDDVRSRLIERFPGYVAWAAEWSHYGAWQTPLGRIVRIPDDHWVINGRRQVTTTAALPCYAQSVEADIIRFALAQAEQHLRGTGGQVVFVHHDAVMLEVPEGNAQEAARRMRHLLEESARTLGFPCPAKVKIGDHWPGRDVPEGPEVLS